VRLQQRSAALAENLRLMSHQLHPTVLQQVGLVAALESHRLEMSRVHGVSMELEIAGEVEPLDQPARLAVFRIAQEAVRNAVVHGRASRVAMSLDRTDGQLALSIRDDGKGFDVDAARRSGGLGLVSIEERARLIKGRVRVVSQPGRGTVIDVTVPVPAPAAMLH
jgi:two-component system sensor histidine kinase UhpB